MHAILDVPRGEYVHLGQFTDVDGTQWWGLWSHRRLCVTAQSCAELRTYIQDRGLILRSVL